MYFQLLLLLHYYYYYYYIIDYNCNTHSNSANWNIF